MALLLIISVFRHITWSSLAARSHDPTKFEHATKKIMYETHNPRNHRLGVVGFGNIGFAIAKKVRMALGMRIFYHDLERKPATQEDEVAAVYYDSLDEMLRVTDCVLLASPGGDPILNARTLALLPTEARVVNIARGSLIDEDALADALESGKISAAALDVHTHEPCPSKRLKDRWDVTVTSHTGGSSLETVKGFEELVLQNVRAVLTGREPLTPVNLIYLPQTANGAATNGHHDDDDGSEGRHSTGVHAIEPT